MDLGLEHKGILVTGGASGIGEAIVRQFCYEGGRVGIVDRDVARGQALEDELMSGGHDAHFFEADLCQAPACQAAVEKMLEVVGRVDVLVNNAGVNDTVGLEAGVEAFEASLRRNLIHYYTMVHYCLSSLRNHQGVIVNIGSKVSVTGQGGTSGYAAAKGGVNGLTREWAADLAASGIRVNAVLPAETWTPMYAMWLATQPNPEQEKQAIGDRIPLGRRFTQPEELAKMVAFLASSAASHVTGQIIHVDGGYVHLDRRL